MTKYVAVITDATSPSFLFPVWAQYYGDLFGRRNLFVVTYDDMKPEFPTDLGFIWDLGKPYSDNIRAKAISSLSKPLLITYDFVIHCDVDEFLIADPRKYASLCDYTNSLSLPYVTARGIDVVEAADEPELTIHSKILSQRKYAVRASTLNKTCITQIGIDWSEGFHGANVYPRFDDILLFHMKFADIKARIAWFRHMSNLNFAPDSKEGRYFSLSGEKLKAHQRWLLTKPVASGWSIMDDTTFDLKFLGTVTYNRLNQIYQGSFIIDDELFEVPDEFRKTV